MWKNNLVIDGVTHIYDLTPENRPDDCPPARYAGFGKFLHRFFHLALESNEPGFKLGFDEFTAPWSAEELADVCFAESNVDIMVYHAVNIEGFFKRGLSPFAIGAELKRSHPERVLLYAPVDPLAGPQELDRMTEYVERYQVDGFKVYPTNGLVNPDSGLLSTVSLADERIAFPIFEHARDLGVPHIAVHKAVPLGRAPLDASRIDDIAIAAAAFQDVTFEIVHSGWAFLDDTATIIGGHPNVYANLEAVANFAVRRPEKFAHILGTMLLYAGPNRIIFGSGAFVGHPFPVMEAFAGFEMPDELRDKYGYPEVTDGMKAKMLGGNMARVHGIDVQARADAIANDEWSRRRGGVITQVDAPWAARRRRFAEGS